MPCSIHPNVLQAAGQVKQNLVEGLPVRSNRWKGSVPESPWCKAPTSEARLLRPRPELKQECCRSAETEGIVPAVLLDFPRVAPITSCLFGVRRELGFTVSVASGSHRILLLSESHCLCYGHGPSRTMALNVS
jgi:hypothetical protein